MEIPYVIVQVLLFMFVAYPMIGYAWTVTRVLWFFYTMFCTFLYFTYLGMVVVALTPNSQVATITASMCFVVQNLMAGFIVHGPVSCSITNLLRCKIKHQSPLENTIQKFINSHNSILIIYQRGHEYCAPLFPCSHYQIQYQLHTKS